MNHITVGIGEVIKNQEEQPVKLIAADMDGTLLDSKGRLNPGFFSVFESLKDKGVMFVAASGRQYYNLLKLFNRVKDDIIFVAENGTYVVFRSRELLVIDIPVNETYKVIQEVREIDGAYPVLCGKNRAYIENDSPEFVKQARTYYERCDIVPDLLDITDDKFLKIAVYDFGGSSINSYPVLQHFNDSLKVVVSGQNWLDVSHRAANKGNALRFLQDYLSVKAEECMAFGDQMNDAEMLQAVSYSYAMANSAEGLKCFAHYMAPSNDENGVLCTIRNFILK